MLFPNRNPFLTDIDTENVICHDAADTDSKDNIVVIPETPLGKGEVILSSWFHPCNLHCHITMRKYNFSSHLFNVLQKLNNMRFLEKKKPKNFVVIFSKMLNQKYVRFPNWQQFPHLQR